MPRTLKNTRRLFRMLEAYGKLPVTLLVVPNSGWTSAQLDELRELSDAGAELAGHGWRHEVRRIRGLRHRLHSALISRNVAEHLALDRAGCIALMRDCFDWFQTYDLPSPGLYVPPAWALGSVMRSDLDELPFKRFETLTGVYVSNGRFHRLPMVGFEADTWLREKTCKVWNRLNLNRADGTGALRIGIHPGDLDLRLRNDLKNVLGIPGSAVSYAELA